MKKRMAMTKNWYQITATKNSAEILIYEQIGENFWGEGVSAKQFVKDLNALDVKTITVRINSPGGNVFDGNAIYNALTAHKADIQVKIDGIAASIASVIAMAGDTVEMPENAMMMIHDPAGRVWGTAEDMIKMAAALGKIKTGLVAAYRGKTRMADDDIAAMMTEETWMTAAEAVEYGFADSMIERVNVQANFDMLGRFRNVPKCLTAISNQNKKKKPDQPKKEDFTMEITLELITSKHPEIVTAILKTVTLDHIRAEHPEIVSELQSAGAKIESERIQAVRGQLIPGHEALVEGLMFDGKTTGPEAAVRILAAEKVIRNQALENNRTDAPDPTVQPSTDGDLNTNADDSLPVAERAKAEWDKDPKLRKEFDGDFEAYLAYEQAVDKKVVKILGNKNRK